MYAHQIHPSIHSWSQNDLILGNLGLSFQNMFVRQMWAVISKSDDLDIAQIKNLLNGICESFPEGVAVLFLFAKTEKGQSRSLDDLQSFVCKLFEQSLTSFHFLNARIMLSGIRKEKNSGI